MNAMRGFILGGFVAAALAGCSNFNAHSEIDALNAAQPVGSAFTQYLAMEYRTYANNEMNSMMDYPDAIHFARKGIATARGDAVLPEPVSDWNLSPQNIEELSAGRGRLIVVFDLGAREIAPQQSALAQARFDCWIEVQEENWADANIPCKNEFLNALAALEEAVKPKGEFMPPVEPTAPMASEPMKPEDAMYLVFFDFDSSAVGSGGQNVLDAVAQEVKSRSLNAVTVVGHTDSSGPEGYNNKLAMRRANAVRDSLIQRGVDAALIKVEGRGESELLVQTPDNVREPANRRAQITFE